MPAWAAWQLQFSQAACGTLRKHVTKPFPQPAAPDCRYCSGILIVFRRNSGRRHVQCSSSRFILRSSLDDWVIIDSSSFSSGVQLPTLLLRWQTIKIIGFQVNTLHTGLPVNMTPLTSLFRVIFSSLQSLYLLFCFKLLEKKPSGRRHPFVGVLV